MNPIVVCFGETLWDVFKDKKVIGGAPLNVGLRLNSLGAQVKVISRVGQDTDGEAILQYLEEQNIDLSSIQSDPELPTGTVQVHLDTSNTATYTITEPVAWDRIAFAADDLAFISESDAFIFGSLSCRNSISKNSLFEYVKRAKFKVFDANLRPPFYAWELISELLNLADMIKLNDEELEEICQLLHIGSKAIDDQIKDLSRVTNTDHICITLGPEGAVFYTHGKTYKNPGYKVIVKDTVGAGDSFLASLIYQFISGTPPQEALDFACAMGSLVASKKGANATVSQKEIKNLQHSNS